MYLADDPSPAKQPEFTYCYEHLGLGITRHRCSRGCHACHAALGCARIQNSDDQRPLALVQLAQTHWQTQIPKTSCDAAQVLLDPEKVVLVEELKGQIIECVADQNGNHVIQKCIEAIKPTKNIMFILEVGPCPDLRKQQWLASCTLCSK